MRASDNRVPEKTGEGIITVLVNRDDSLPEITNGIFDVIDAPISENLNIGLSVAVVGASDADIIEDGDVSFPHLNIIK